MFSYLLIKKEVTMKKSQQFFQPNFLFRKTSRVLAFVFSITTVMTGCKKEFSPPGSDVALTAAAKTSSSKGRAPDIIVHAGSSIQAAVDAASAGQIINIEPGTYNEAVVVNKQGIQLIGLTGADNAGVIIQNPGDEENGITVQDEGDGFVLKNVTVQNFEENGVYLSHVDNFLLSHVVTINNGEYGLFPVFCKNGVVEYCSATGHTDTGIYIGQSESITLEHNVAFANVNGLEIENCTDITVSKNQSYNNVCGILIVLLPGLTVKTSANILVSNNHVYGNNHINFAVPGGGFESFVPSGSGILVVGVDNVTVKDNNIKDNNFVGVATVSTLTLGAIAGLPPEAFGDIEPNPDGAKMISNVLGNNGAAPPVGIPLPGVDLLWDGSGTNNCWSNNHYSTWYPSSLPVCN
jgi:parallel beta-helix repeat protein